MAETKDGKKIVHVDAYTKHIGKRTVKVPEHYRSTPN